MTAEQTSAAAKRVLDICRRLEIMVATAESCTGGLVAAELTAIPGSSAVVDRGFVTYSNAAKTEMLGVPPDLIATHGAVSADVAAAMADGALARCKCGAAVALTGIAGPDGGTIDKPVGLVWFGLAVSGQPTMTDKQVFSGDRATVRALATDHALDLLERELTRLP